MKLQLLLCFFGAHKWGAWFEHPDHSTAMQRYCRYCDKLQTKGW